jgi:cellulose synthase/poly-beta-1,6-N-acetylglucosamine synthase-like glycosyltransferase
MDWYVYVAWMLIVLQVLFSTLTLKNYLFALAKYRRNKRHYTPRTALIIPCKNLDENFEQNIASFYGQDYGNYLLWFVVEDKADPAYEPLCKLKDKLAGSTNAMDVRVLVAGAGQECSQKIHNLLYAYHQVPGDVEVLAFADSDICVKPTWLHYLVYPLRHPETRGAATGYRWLVPETNNLATLALSAVNAKIAQLLGNTPFNHAWGGSMAIRVQLFRELGIEKLWQKALSDDYSLSCAVKDANKKVEFVPGCLVATSESTTWAKLFEFGRRQFVITKVYAPQTWSFGLFSSVYSVFGLWAGTALAIYARITQNHHICIFTAVPVLFFIAQLTRAILRQSMASKLLAEDWPRLKIAAIADIALFWLWSPLMLILILSSAFGRTICWRGIRYKLVSQSETIVLGTDT